MDPSREEVEIPMPLNSAYPSSHVHCHVPNMLCHHHHHHDEQSHSHTHLQVTPSNGPLISIALNHENHHHHHHDHVLLFNNKQGRGGQVIYRECQKNYAASMGGSVTDGCGEFIPSGEEGEIEAFTCSVCNCHRNFHRKEVEGYPKGRKVLNLGHHKNMLGHPTTAAGALVSGGIARPVPIIPHNMGSLLVCSLDQSDGQDERDDGGAATASAGVAYMGFPPPPPPSSQSHHHNQILKKRFRTKFTPEQKEKLLSFADKVGWTIQKQEESVVQQFCQEIGVKRKVLKVWMHNNKHNLNKKSSPITDG